MHCLQISILYTVLTFIHVLYMHRGIINSRGKNLVFVTWPNDYLHAIITVAVTNNSFILYRWASGAPASLPCRQGDADRPRLSLRQASRPAGHLARRPLACIRCPGLGRRLTFISSSGCWKGTFQRSLLMIFVMQLTMPKYPVWHKYSLNLTAVKSPFASVFSNMREYMI